jgi:hypothetical protein
MGITQTSPAFATFTVKPRLGSVASATILVPTVRGDINVTAGRGYTMVAIPCSTVATVCVFLHANLSSNGELHSAGSVASNGVHSAASARVTLDGVIVSGRVDGNHACVDNLGCGVGGSLRAVALLVS